MSTSARSALPTPMPPAKTPPKPKANGAEEALVMFTKNLEEMRRWYRGASYAGREAGHIVMNEMVLANVSTALALALEGKCWSPPADNP